jgi:tetratricopeptide (TPR) repeat protein
MPREVSRTSLRQTLLLAGVAAAVALGFRGARDLGFVWDDHVLVAANPALAGAGGLAQALRSDLYLGDSSGAASSGYWRPVAVLSFAANALFGGGPSPLHVGNVLLHATVAALLAWLLTRRVGSWAAGVAAALLWAFHPEQVETVAWISARYDVLTALALVAMLLVRPTPGKGRAALQGAMFLAGLLSKEGFVVAAAVVAADDWAERRPWREALPRWGAMGAAVALSTAARALLGIRAVVFDLSGAVAELPRAYPSVVATYAIRAVAPFPLSIGHAYQPLGPVGLSAGVALVVGLVVLAVRVRRLRIPVAVFLAPLLPVAIACAGLGVAAERYFYLPSIGLAWLLAEGLSFVRARVVQAGVPGASIPIAVGGIVVAAALAVAARIPDWRSDGTLFTSALAVDPGEWQANLNLGIAAVQAGKLDDGIEMLERAGRRNGHSPEVASALAWGYLLSGRPRAALAEAERAIALDSSAPQAHIHLAAALHALGAHDAEQRALGSAVKLAPGYAPLVVLSAATACDVTPAVGCELELVRLASGNGPAAADAAAEVCAVALRRGDRASAAQWLERLRIASPSYSSIPQLEREIGRSTGP